MENRKVESVNDLVVWQKSHELVQQVYSLTAKFPKRELASLAESLRQAVLPLPIQIAQGFNKHGKRNKIHFYQQALNCIEEVRYRVLLAQDLGFMKKQADLAETVNSIERMLKRLIRSVASSSPSQDRGE
ncbi:MAG TPA: four helix bundle protein [bacterium]|jgi:four helix bundle protein|nr:four helix bundle protein [bacterium]HNT64787.1 four helix bundle protein [bacterium]HOX85948.1 four helix bundle protein [bacterium]HPG45069.1 four helix bundle protein [bacterium]HPM97311.1 four helix bundle protein [bacterium]